MKEVRQNHCVHNGSKYFSRIGVGHWSKGVARITVVKLTRPLLVKPQPSDLRIDELADDSSLFWPPPCRRIEHRGNVHRENGCRKIAESVFVGFRTHTYVFSLHIHVHVNTRFWVPVVILVMFVIIHWVPLHSIYVHVHVPGANMRFSLCDEISTVRLRFWL